MKNLFLFIFISVLTTIVIRVSTHKSRMPQSENLFSTEIVEYLPAQVSLRLAQFRANSEVEFKGCVLYLQGLGDSVLNHEPLFKKLSDHGFRVISFDYMGQGASGGSMNNTRIHDNVTPSAWLISSQADWVWTYFSNDSSESGSQNCSNSKRRVIGWSTGGLAAYKLAHDEWALDVVLIAPGINPKALVGNAAINALNIFKKDVISPESLTRANYTSSDFNPHIDPIKPTSPIQVPLFATNLLLTAQISHTWSINSKVNGLVLLSGKTDTYVDSEQTKILLHGNKTQAAKAPHFQIHTYEGALHELDNEISSVSDNVHERIVQFFLN